MVAVKLPDGSVRKYPDNTSAKAVAESIGKGLAKAAVAARVDGNIVDLTRPIASGQHDFAILTDRDPDALQVLRHSTAHVMAEAIQRIWPQAQLAYGPPVENGFFYDIALENPISSSDFEGIEKEMAEIVKEDRPFTRYEMPATIALEKLIKEGNKYKVDNANRAVYASYGAETPGKTVDLVMQLRDEDPLDLAHKVIRSLKTDARDPTISFYVSGPLHPDGDAPASRVVAHTTNYELEKIGAGYAVSRPYWEDLCMGPHVPSTGRIKAFKVMSVSQSHWHGDVKSDKFQRVYGTAFFDKKQLDEYLNRIDEAKKRDHRFLGPQLGLFTIDEKVGQGLILWKPKGAQVRIELQNFISEHLKRQGYKQVFTPHIGRLELYKTSGHFPYYRDSQFPPIIDREFFDGLAKENCGCAELSNRLAQGDIEGYLLKPMNCPMHIRIYASDPHSYRDLPVRLAEFGTVYRWEKSGELGGMTRVRGFTQDDAHLFCTEEQLQQELLGCLELVKIILGTLKMTDFRVRVGMRSPDSKKYVGEAQQWDRAEAACKVAAESLGVQFSLEPGEAAFYGPKIDFVVRDVIGREWQLGTVQVDYQLPQRFDLSYIGADNHPHRPVIIHRAPFGSMERFIAVLIEHFAGAFPLWLAPVQVAVLTISEKSNEYAHKISRELQLAGLRFESNLSGEKIGAKIRTATMDKVPYMLVIGEKEAAANVVAVRTRSGADLGQMPVRSFLDRAKQEVTNRIA